jgi:hypothetical protein
MALCWLISVVELTTVTEGDGDGCVVMGWIENIDFSQLEKSRMILPGSRNDEG